VSDPKDETQIFDSPHLLQRQASDENRVPVLVVVQGEEIGRRYPLMGQRFILGRDPRRADITVADRGISGKHLMVQLDPRRSRYGVIDLASRNGTFVNGERIESAALRDGDKIFIGKTVLKFTLQDSIEKDYHSQLDELMHIDSLTGLYVRRWFDVEYPKAFAAAKEEGMPMCVLMMDMDGLKEVNDVHGHTMGSYCISETGKIILNHIDPNGVGARFGGDEYVAYLRNCDLDVGLEVAEQIREAVDAFTFCKDGIEVAPTISIGVMALADDIETAEELMQLADEALYRAKKAGRNSVAGGDG
jgi:diguanylate cyclase (GGDEF)-like protein